jgi:hypothetical protein
VFLAGLCTANLRPYNRHHAMAFKGAKGHCCRCRKDLFRVKIVESEWYHGRFNDTTMYSKTQGFTSSNINIFAVREVSSQVSPFSFVARLVEGGKYGRFRYLHEKVGAAFAGEDVVGVGYLFFFGEEGEAQIITSFKRWKK